MSAVSRAKGQATLYTGFVSLGTKADTPDMLAQQSGYILEATERVICARPVTVFEYIKSASSLDDLYDTL
jgi:hypothetical protein